MVGARALMAFRDGEDTDEAFTGAMLVADALVSISALIKGLGGGGS